MEIIKVGQQVTYARTKLIGNDRIDKSCKPCFFHRRNTISCCKYWETMKLTCTGLENNRFVFRVFLKL